MVEFIAAGSPQSVSRAIEAYAAERRLVSAIVVPWESDRVTLSMSVTAVSGDGWAIEHTNLGTIRLSDLGNDRTRVAAAADDSANPDRQRRMALFDRFAEQIQKQFRIES
jgi:hypothetical protein